MFAFVGCCLGYFLLCRRLSLVLEWVFLCGFVGSLPFLVAAKSRFQTRKWRWLWEIAMTIAAFSAFYWSAVAVLWFRQ